MKKLFRLQILLALWPLSIAHGQWVQTKGPGGGGASKFVVRDGKIFAASQGGLFVTTDNGATWKTVNSGLRNFGYAPSLSTLFFADSVLIAGGQAGCGVCRSIDDGANWVKGSAPDIVHDFAKMGEALFAASNTNGILKSADFGFTWQKSALSGVGTLGRLGTYGPKLFAGGSGIYRSVDSGATWGNRDTTVRNSNISAIVGSGLTLIAGYHAWPPSPAYFTSKDSGATWQGGALPIQAGIIWSLAAGGGRIYAGTDSGYVASSPDTSLSWTHSNTGLPRKTITGIFAGDGFILAGVKDNGVFVSHDKGSTWKDASHGFAASRVNRLAVVGKTLFATTTSGDFDFTSYAFRSDDYGETWERLGSNLPQLLLARLIALNGKLYLGMEGMLFVSRDKGTSWERLEITQQDTLTGFVSGYDNHLYASAKNSLWHSSDGGASWNATTLPAPKGQFQFAKTSTGLFAAEMEGANYLSSDGGVSWTYVRTHMEDPRIRDIFVQDNILYANTPSGIYVSGDNGKSWAEKLHHQKNPMTQMIGIGGRIFGCKSSLGDTVGVYSSSDKGSSWAGIGSGLDNKSVHSLAVAGEYLFAATFGSGVWRRPLTELGVGVGGPHSADLKYSRFRVAFGRTANSTLAISLILSHPEVVKVTLFDPSWKAVATLSDSYREAGAQSLTWNHGHLTSGIYFVQIQVGRDRVWKPVPLVR